MFMEAGHHHQGPSSRARRTLSSLSPFYRYIPLFAIVIIIYVLFVTSSQVKEEVKVTSPAEPESKLPVWINNCPKGHKLKDPPPYTRQPTMVLFVHHQNGAKKDENTRFFLKHGLCKNCADIDFYFIINGESTLEEEGAIPKHSNFFVFKRENKCGDFGAWGHVLDTLGPEKLKKYKRFMFINDSVRGPFMDPKYSFALPKDFHFVDIFAQRLTEETRIVGSYINCGNWPGYPPHAHVQSMVFMLDEKAFDLSRDRIKCHVNLSETVLQGEIGVSRNLVTNHDINLGSLMYAYNGVDFRCNDPYRYHCNDGVNPVQYNWYFGNSVNPYEAVFFKTSFDERNISGRYTDWMEREGINFPS